MLFGRIENVSESDIAIAKDRVIEATSTRESVLQILLNSDLWKKKQEELFSAQIEEITEKAGKELNELGPSDEGKYKTNCDAIQKRRQAAINTLIEGATKEWLESHFEHLTSFLTTKARKRIGFSRGMRASISLSCSCMFVSTILSARCSAFS